MATHDMIEKMIPNPKYIPATTAIGMIKERFFRSTNVAVRVLE